MPRLSAFYGIVIYMYVRDHGPPHYHAAYGDDVAQIVISNGNVREGSLPPRALRLVRIWHREHQAELEAAWAAVSSGEPPGTIEPLP
jgi:hypothetical protein